MTIYIGFSLEIIIYISEVVFNSSIIFLLISGVKFPVFLVNCLRPLGHSGHPRLQVVVGSILNANGEPKTNDFLVILERIKLR